MCRFRSLPSMSLPLYPEARLGFATLSLYRDLAAFQPDVAHLFHPVMTGIPTMGMLKWMDVPTVTSFHLDYARLANQFKVGSFDFGFTRPLIDELTKNIFQLVGLQSGAFQTGAKPDATIGHQQGRFMASRR